MLIDEIHHHGDENHHHGVEINHHDEIQGSSSLSFSWFVTTMTMTTSRERRSTTAATAIEEEIGGGDFAKGNGGEQRLDDTHNAIAHQISNPSEPRIRDQRRPELKDLRSQLYHAADYCESAFLKTTQKKILLENTKSYVCEVIVTVVDHLGTVSSNLEQRVQVNNNISQTEQRIDCLEQRLLTCAFSLDLSSLPWRTKFPRYHQHYFSPLDKNLEKFSAVPRADAIDSRMAAETSPCKKDKFTETNLEPMFHVGIIIKPSVSHFNFGTGLKPASQSPSRFLRPFNPLFGLPTKVSFKLGSSDPKKEAVQGGNFLSFLRKSKRKT